ILGLNNSTVGDGLEPQAVCIHDSFGFSSKSISQLSPHFSQRKLDGQKHRFLSSSVALEFHRGPTKMLATQTGLVCYRKAVYHLPRGFDRRCPAGDSPTDDFSLSISQKRAHFEMPVRRYGFI